MKQKFYNNSDYEILTPNGWEDFDGIIHNIDANKQSKILFFDDSTSICATLDHKFYKDSKEIRVEVLTIGDHVDTIDNIKLIKNIEDINLNDTFEIFNAENHVIIANDILSHQCDEMAFLKPQVAQEFWSAMAPTLSTGGRCIITSTPKSDEDLFAELWYGANKTIDEFGNEIPDGIGINGFKAFTVDYTEAPGRDEEWAKKEIAKIGEEKFAREYRCQFTGEDSTLISGITLQRLEGKLPIKTVNNIRYYETISPEKTYLVGYDPSAGVGRDSACISVWSLPDLTQVAEWSHNKTSIPGQVKIFQKIINDLHDEIKRQGFKGDPEIYFTLENNSWGEAALVSMAEIGEENFLGQFLHEPRRSGLVHRKGLNTNKRTKSPACSKLKSLIESNRLKINSKNLVRELKFFVSKGDSFEAAPGQHDDTIMATLLCIRMMQMVTNWDDKMGDIMKDAFLDDSTEERDPMPFSILIN